ncbi:winged helix-turn-helix transcriptional regulator [soil metagenome]
MSASSTPHPDLARPDASAFNSRTLLDQISDKWTVLILGALCPGPLRFNALKRALDGVTQTALTNALRRLERNGVIDRRVVERSPIAVEYAITPLGRTLEPLFQSLETWTRDHLQEVETSRARFDEAAAR